jgi:tetratricopeptide (TPR) repeat protein
MIKRRRGSKCLIYLRKGFQQSQQQQQHHHHYHQQHRFPLFNVRSILFSNNNNNNNNTNNCRQFATNAFLMINQASIDQQQENYFRSIVKKGDEFLKEGKYEKAIPLYQMAMDVLYQDMRGPENDKEAVIFIKYKFYVLDSMRECYEMLSQYENAIKMCQEFLNLEKDLIKLRVLDQWEETLDFLAIKKTEYLIYLKRHEDALLLLNNLIEKRLYPAYNLNQENEKTKKHLLSALTQRGRIYTNRSDYDLALHSLEKALKLVPYHSEALALKSYCLVKKKQYSQAEIVAKSVIDKYIISTPDYQCRMLYAETLLERGEYDKCIELCTKTLKLYPNEKITLIYKAQAHLGKYEYQSALSDVREYENTRGIQNVTIVGEISSTTVFLAQCLLGSCKFKAAHELLSNRLKEVDLDKEAYNDNVLHTIILYAITKYHLGNSLESINLFKKYILPRLEIVYWNKPEQIIRVNNSFVKSLIKHGNLSSAHDYLKSYIQLVESLNASSSLNTALAIDEYFAIGAELAALMNNRVECIEMMDRGKAKLLLDGALSEESSDKHLIHGKIAQGMIHYYMRDYQKAFHILSSLLNSGEILHSERASSLKEISKVIEDCQAHMHRSQE